MTKLIRPEITPADIAAGMEFFRKRYVRARKRKGESSFASSHEILGKVTEEYFETIEAVHKGSKQDIELELSDVAIAAIWGIICLRSKKAKA